MPGPKNAKAPKDHQEDKYLLVVMQRKLTRGQRVMAPVPRVHINELAHEETDIDVMYSSEIPKNEFLELVIVGVFSSTNEGTKALSIVSPAIACDEDGTRGVGETVRWIDNGADRSIGS